MTTIERAVVLLSFIGVVGFFWAHHKNNQQAEWLFGGIVVAAVLLGLFLVALGEW